MSTLSPEAKQAAEEWCKGKYHTVYERECFAEGYDTATAKLNILPQDSLDGFLAFLTRRGRGQEKFSVARVTGATVLEIEKLEDEAAKLREAFEQYVSNEGGMNFEKFAAIMRGQQLAHQQPSAETRDVIPAEECKEKYKQFADLDDKPSAGPAKIATRDDVKNIYAEGLQVGMSLGKQQPSAKVEDWQDDPAKVAANKAFSAKVNAIKSGEPSATTAENEQDVQMALRAADAKDAGHWPTVAGVLADEVRRLHQARAPLVVEALEAWRNLPHMIEPHCDDCARAVIRAMELSEAALTDRRGEKK